MVIYHIDHFFLFPLLEYLASIETLEKLLPSSNKAGPYFLKCSTSAIISCDRILELSSVRGGRRAPDLSFEELDFDN